MPLWCSGGLMFVFSLLMPSVLLVYPRMNSRINEQDQYQKEDVSLLDGIGTTLISVYGLIISIFRVIGYCEELLIHSYLNFYI